MRITVRAVYHGGMFRLELPLPLADGETVEVTVATAKPAAPSLAPFGTSVRRVNVFPQPV
jgi:hypothetical protein